jgi:hypothetical protein
MEGLTMHRYASAIVTILLAAGTGYAVHRSDQQTLNTQIVQNYNGGFVDGMCAGSPSVAEKQYHFTCKG